MYSIMSHHYIQNENKHNVIVYAKAWNMNYNSSRHLLLKKNVFFSKAKEK